MPEPVVVPKLNENDDEVVVVALAEGQISRGKVLFEVETSKAVQEVEAEADGWPRWTVAVGDHVPVLSTIGWLCATEAEAKEAIVPVSDTETDRPQSAGGRPATEPARRLAAELGVSLDDVPGSGIVRESDVRAVASSRASEPPEVSETGRLAEELRARLKSDPAGIRDLSSEDKVALYREHGAAIGDNVSIGARTVIDAEFVEIGADTSIGSDCVVRARRFAIGELGQIGDNCRFFCRDFVAGDVVTLRWNVAVVDGQGGIHDCRIGDLCFIAYDTYLNTDRDVTLGERVCLSPGARIYTHRKWLEALDGYPYSYQPVSVGERSWLGPGALILPGVTLDAEVTVMANSVVASNASRGALLGGVPASVVRREQRVDLSASQRAMVVREIFEGNAEALAKLGWSLRDGTLSDGTSETPVTVDARRITVGETVFDLDARRVSGPRTPATDVIRHLLFKYGHSFEPRLWRYGARTDEASY